MKREDGNLNPRRGNFGDIELGVLASSRGVIYDKIQRGVRSLFSRGAMNENLRKIFHNQHFLPYEDDLENGGSGDKKMSLSTMKRGLTRKLNEHEATKPRQIFSSLKPEDTQNKFAREYRQVIVKRKQSAPKLSIENKNPVRIEISKDTIHLQKIRNSGKHINSYANELGLNAMDESGEYNFDDGFFKDYGDELFSGISPEIIVEQETRKFLNHEASHSQAKHLPAENKGMQRAGKKISPPVLNHIRSRKSEQKFNNNLNDEISKLSSRQSSNKMRQKQSKKTAFHKNLIDQNNVRNSVAKSDAGKDAKAEMIEIGLENLIDANDNGLSKAKDDIQNFALFSYNSPNQKLSFEIKRKDYLEMASAKTKQIQKKREDLNGIKNAVKTQNEDFNVFVESVLPRLRRGKFNGELQKKGGNKKVNKLAKWEENIDSKELINDALEALASV